MNFDKFIEKKLEKEEILNELKEIEVDTIGKLIFKRLPDYKYIQIVDSCTGKTTEWMYSLYTKLIYTCCDDFKNTELHRELEIKVPYDLITELFTISEVIEIGRELHQWHENSTKLNEKIKN